MEMEKRVTWYNQLQVQNQINGIKWNIVVGIERVFLCACEK